MNESLNGNINILEPTAILLPMTISQTGGGRNKKTDLQNGWIG